MAFISFSHFLIFLLCSFLYPCFLFGALIFATEISALGSTQAQGLLRLSGNDCLVLCFVLLSAAFVLFYFNRLTQAFSCVWKQIISLASHYVPANPFLLLSIPSVLFLFLFREPKGCKNVLCADLIV